MERILSLSYGKDSLACLFACRELGWHIDRVVTADIWATKYISADHPDMVDFKASVDRYIEREFGLAVEHVTADSDFESLFYTTVSKGRKHPEYEGHIRGWPLVIGHWCQRDLKLAALRKLYSMDAVFYLGIAADEPKRFGQLNDRKRSPLVAAGWDERKCREVCFAHGLLSPVYQFSRRSGCFFCPFQPVDQLRLLRKDHPYLWGVMMDWDSDSVVPFRSNGRTLADYDKRFEMEDKGLISVGDRSFRWKMLDDLYQEKAVQ